MALLALGVVDGDIGTSPLYAMGECFFGPHHADATRAADVLGALGVVFGDIGTSPLYAIQTVFSVTADRPVPVTQADVYGVISLVFWAVTIIVTLKYVLLIMRADNDGEGGIMALIALLSRLRANGVVKLALPGLAALGIFGAALFVGDSMLTPAISVLSAVEGLTVVQASLEHLVVPIAVAIIVGLFAIQRHGTAVVGRLFGPIVVVWFGALATLGIKGIAGHPGILRALSPIWAVQFFADRGLTAYLALGGVFLAVTGAEALYADMGHFGRGPIRRAWLLIVFPALMLNYMGQGALLLENPAGAANPFYLLVPHWARIPMIVLATMATIIASQAVISGAFSVTRQAIRLGYLPRLRILHPSAHEGQIYLPLVNWTLLAGVIALVLTFEHSANLAHAYGIAVIGTITITTLLFFVVARTRGHTSLPLVIAGVATFGLVDLAFLGANAVKIASGGWLPLTVAAIVCFVLFTWQKGRAIVTHNREALEGRLREFVSGLRSGSRPAQRVPGTAVFLNRGSKTTPLAMRALVQHTQTLHEHVIVLSIETPPVPFVADADRLTIDNLLYDDDGITHVTARYGFQEKPDVLEILRLAEKQGLDHPIEIDDASYFLSTIDIVPTDAPGMSRWRKRVFCALARLAADPIEYCVLPRERTVLMGAHVDL
jgi:KUP system potassium uptake protein